MSLSMSVLIVFALSVVGYILASRRALGLVNGDRRKLASLPKQYGLSAGLSVFLPAMLIALLAGLGGAAGPVVPAIIVAVAVVACCLAILKSRPEFIARNRAETLIKAVLIAASGVAILTTIGIVMSLLFETANFFRDYSWTDFFFSTTWSPNFRGDSALGILPLLWGTLYISFIALTFAVPIGLFAAIYLSEYASPRMRSVAKPAIEILAGIPTIVYGLFALITVGPFLRDYFASPMGFGQSASSVMTAGLVMGVMLIPFVSSLSDDIINAVPQARVIVKSGV